MGTKAGRPVLYFLCDSFAGDARYVYSYLATPSKTSLFLCANPFTSPNLARLKAVDLAPLYHPSVTPKFVFVLRDYYIATYSDRFFSPQAPAWFRVYIWMEALYHLPLSIWALKGLWQGTLYL